MNKEEFDLILEKKGIVKSCREIWWTQWESYQAKFGGNKELLESLLIEAVIKKGCQAPYGL